LRLGARILDLRKESYEIEERKVGGKSWSGISVAANAEDRIAAAFESKTFTAISVLKSD
jgi:hypothetical protein